MNTFLHLPLSATGERLISALFFCFCLLSASFSIAEEINIKATANRSQIYIGESFILEITVSGSTGPGEVDFSGIKNANIRPLGSRNISNYSITIINGAMTRKGFTGFVSSYEITPLAAGQFQAGPITVNIEGKILTDIGPTLTVTDIEKQDRLIIAVTSSRETTLIDEPFEVNLSLKIQCLPGDSSGFDPLLPDHPPHLTIPWLEQEMKGLAGPDIRQLLTGLLAPHWNQPGVTINNFALAPDPFDLSSMFTHEQRKAKFALPKKIIQMNGRQYYEYSLQFNYLPKDEGNYVFGPVIFKGQIPERIDEQGHAIGVNIFAVGPACTVRVIPPPDEGRPLSYSGAIGSNMTVRASLDTGKCNVGDPLKLTLTAAGQVKLDKMLPPKLSLQTNILQNFTVYDNTVQTVKKDSYSQYIYTIRPDQAGNYEIPPIELSFYDVVSRSYKKVFTVPIPLQVRRGTEVTASQVIGGTNHLAAEKDEMDIRKQANMPIRLDNAGAVPANLFGDYRIAAAAGAGPVLYLLTVLGGFIRRAGWKIKKSRHKYSAQYRACVLLKRAVHLGKNDSSRGAGLICEAVRKYLGERLVCDTAALIPVETVQLLKNNGVSPELADNFGALYEKYFNAGFTGGSLPGSAAEDCKTLMKLLKRIENELRKKD